MTDRRYPIGLFELKDTYSDDEVREFIRIIAEIPTEYRNRVARLSDENLLRTYREGSWNIRQLIHHVADLQFVHYLRMKKAITEPDYTEVTLIDMNAWAGTPDSLNVPIESSLAIFEGTHARYAYLAASLNEEQLAKRYYHPTRKFWFDQKQALAMSVWHVKHHLAHIDLALSNTE
ncbi:putative metal-dependent hydrolase [Dyadobacter sp. CY261]|uniref:YfiT family bacillithiol transferase n=1 Tax=Dyadobacter sp. CY261 TaxID=2907203 RepID=UPI001F1DA55E|nr:putative metal-dependent hydrolase [Dyadobacter sp. CY261]MCF0073577.1 putative metal-dependent hydrolase [Dyadobacter sp. CY261]